MREIGLQLDPKPKWLVLAENESRFAGHNFVCTEQLLLGLMGFKESIACCALRSMGLSLRDLQVDFESTLGLGTCVGLRLPANLAFTKQAEQTFKGVVKIARKRDQTVNTGHLLLSILEYDSAAVRILEYRLDLKALRKRVTKLLDDEEAIKLERINIHAPVEIENSENEFKFGRLSKDCANITRFAEEEALRLKLSHITPDLFLLGIVGDNGCTGARLLRLTKVDFNDVQMRVREEFTRKRKTKSFDSRDIRYSHRAMYALERSWEEAKQAGQEQIDSGHLLISLFREEVRGLDDILRLLSMYLGQKLGVDSLIRNFDLRRQLYEFLMAQGKNPLWICDLSEESMEEEYRKVVGTDIATFLREELLQAQKNDAEPEHCLQTQPEHQVVKSADKAVIYTTLEFEQRKAEKSTEAAETLQSPQPDPEKEKTSNRLLKDRLNPLLARISHAWTEYGNGVTYVQIHFTVLPGRKIRLDHARLSDRSNARRDECCLLLPGEQDRIIESLHKSFASINGEPGLDNVLRGDPEFSYSFWLSYGAITQLGISANRLLGRLR